MAKLSPRELAEREAEKLLWKFAAKDLLNRISYGRYISQPVRRYDSLSIKAVVEVVKRGDTMVVTYVFSDIPEKDEILNRRFELFQKIPDGELIVTAYFFGDVAEVVEYVEKYSSKY